jgi:hypothetical protein
MKKHFILSVIIILTAFGKIIAQTYAPIATTGYGLDGVAENTTAIVTTGAAMDNSDFVLYSQYYGTLFSTGAVGLPNNGTIVSGTRTYQLQNYTGSNVLQIPANLKDSITFVTPQAFPAISLLCFATQGNATMNVTVRFTDNTTQVFSALYLDDWFNTTPSILNGFDRVSRTSGVPAYVGSAGNPRMFGTDLNILCANQGKPIKRVTIQNNSTAYVCIMAVSGNTPVYSATASAPLICSGANATLNAAGLTSYTWQPTGNFAGSNAATVNVTPTTTTTYTLTGNNGGCPGYAMVTISVSSGPPSLSLTGSSQSVCLGAAATITASGAINYTLSNSAVNGGTFIPAATAVYTVTGANGCGSGSLTTTITVSPLPVTAATTSTLVCAGTPATLTAGGATTYSWMPGANTSTNYIAAPLANTIYTVTGITGNCQGTATITVNTKPLPTLNVIAASTAICNGDFTTLNVTGNALTYTWSPGGPGNSITVSPTNVTLYSVTGTNSVNCVNTAQQVILVNPLPVLSTSVSDPLVCSGGASTLAVSGASTYAWTGDATASTASLVVNPVIDGTYNVTGTSSLGCSSSTVVTVSVYMPTITVSSNTTICLGASAIIGADVADTWLWSNGSNFQNITVSPSLTTVYTVTASVNNLNGLSCPTTNTVQVAVNPLPVITATSNYPAICIGTSALLTASGAGAGGTYTWTGGAGAQISASIQVAPIANQSYSVTGIDANGCKGTSGYLLIVSQCVGIPVNIANTANLSIYPNPSTGEFTISADQAITLQIINELGQQVKTITLDKNNREVNSLPGGVYFITGNNENGSVKEKIIIAN